MVVPGKHFQPGVIICKTLSTGLLSGVVEGVGGSLQRPEVDWRRHLHHLAAQHHLPDPDHPWRQGANVIKLFLLATY